MSNCVNWSFVLLRLMTAFTVAWPPLRAAGTLQGSHSLTWISRRESCTGNRDNFPNKKKAIKFEFPFSRVVLEPTLNQPKSKVRFLHFEGLKIFATDLGLGLLYVTDIETAKTRLLFEFEYLKQIYTLRALPW